MHVLFLIGILLPIGEVYSQEQLQSACELPVSETDCNDISEEDNLEDEKESWQGCLQNGFQTILTEKCSYFLEKTFYRQFRNERIDSPPRL